MSNPFLTCPRLCQLSLLGLWIVGLGCGDDVSSSSDAHVSASDGTSGSTTLLSKASETEVVPIDCANTVEIDGDLIVGEDQPPGPAARHVRGSVRVMDTIARTDLDHLRCLVEVDGDLVIGRNFRLTDVSGLESLERVGGDLVFSGNEALVSVGPLPRVRELGGVELESNPELTHFELGVARLQLGSAGSPNERATGVSVDHNDSLEVFSMGVDEVRSESAINLSFRRNEALSSIDVEVFADVRVSGFEVSESPLLRQLRFGGVELDVLLLDDNPLLSNLEGFGELEVVDLLRITPGAELEDFRDLSSLRDVTQLRVGPCRDWDGGGVKSLDGLEGLRGLQSIIIASNPRLEDISALSSAETILLTLAIQDNPLLTAAAIDEVTAGLGVDPRAPHVCGNMGADSCVWGPFPCPGVFR